MTTAILNRNLTVPTRTLQWALKEAKRVIEKRNAVPILAHVLLTDEKLIATDLDMALTIDLTGAIQARDLPFTVSADALLKAVTGTDADQIHAEALAWPTAADRAGAMRWIIGDMTVDLESLLAEDFPIMQPATKMQPMATIPARDLHSALNVAAHSISDEKTRYYLNGINFCGEQRREGERPTLTLVSTDGYRLTHARMEGHTWEKNRAPMDAMILPTKTVQVLTALTATEAAPVKIEANGTTRMTFSGTGWTLDTKVIDGSFPDYTRIMPRPSSEKGASSVDCDEIKAKAKRLQALTEARSCAMKVDAITGTLSTMGSGAMKSITIKTDFGPADHDDPCPVYGVNARYMAEAMEAVRKLSERAIILAEDAANPHRIRPVTQPSWGEVTLVCMPMRF